MSDTKIDIDVSKALAEIAQLKQGVAALSAEVGKAKTASQGLFVSEGQNALEVAGDIEKLRSEYHKLQQAEATLKRAQKSAFDPRAIEEYSKALGQAQAGLRKYEQTAKATGVSLKRTAGDAGTAKEAFSQLFGTFSKAGLIAGAIALVGKYTLEAVKLAAAYEVTAKQFEAFLGSAAKADATLKELNRTAAQNRIDPVVYQDAGKALLGFGESAGNLPEVLTRITEISKGTGKDLNELAIIYGKARVAGVLYAEDINQLTEAGVPIIGQFAKQLGVSADQVKKLASEGKISFTELELAFANLTAEGGRFAGQIEATANSVSGNWDALTAKFNQYLISVGNYLKPVTNFLIEFASAALDVGIILTNLVKGFLSGNLLTSNPFAGTYFDPENRKNVAKDSRDLYEQEKDQRETLEALDKKASEERRKRNAVTAAEVKKAREEAAKADQERERLRISLIADEYAREIALENQRYKELISNLEKYFKGRKELNGLLQQAETQHIGNLRDIDVKRLQDEAQKLQELEALRNAQFEFEADQRNKDLKEKRAALDNERAIRDEQLKIGEQSAEATLLRMKALGAKESEIQATKAEFDLALQQARLQIEIDFQEKLLSLTDAGDTQQIALIRKKIEALKAELGNVNFQIDNPDPKKKTFLESLGLDKDGIETLKDAVGQVKDVLSGLAQARTDAAQAKADAAAKEVQVAQDALDREIEIAQAGYSNNVDLKRKELADAEARQKQAQQKAQEAARAQILLDSAVQASGLVTSFANILKGFSTIPLIGQILGIAAIGATLTGFLAAKQKALASTKKFKHGGGGRIDSSGFITGPSHEAGGVGIEVEGGELFGTDGRRFAVVNKRMTSKHFEALQAINKDDKPAIVRALSKIAGVNRSAVSDTLTAPGVSLTSRKSRDGKTLEKIESNTREREQTFVVGGKLITKKGGRTTTVKI